MKILFCRLVQAWGFLTNIIIILNTFWYTYSKYWDGTKISYGDSDTCSRIIAYLCRIITIEQTLFSITYSAKSNRNPNRDAKSERIGSITNIKFKIMYRRCKIESTPVECLSLAKDFRGKQKACCTHDCRRIF